jgi:hypothetical protein
MITTAQPQTSGRATSRLAHDQLVASGSSSRLRKIPTAIRIFSGRCVCSVCGGPMHSIRISQFVTKRGVKKLRKSGPTAILVCGKRNRVGVEGCTNPARPKEADLLAMVQAGIRGVIQQRDQIIERAMEIAEKSVNSNDRRRNKLTDDLAKAHKSIDRYSRLMRDVSDDQVKTLLGQIATIERERDQINQDLLALAAEASFDRQGLLREVRAAMDEAEGSILLVTDTPTLNRAIERFVGRIAIGPDGSVGRASEVGGDITGGRVTTGMHAGRRKPP